MIMMLLLFITLTWGGVDGNIRAGDSPNSQWVSMGPEGKLVYKSTARGDRIMDFSHAGYGGGGVALPRVGVKRVVKPSGGEDTAIIQEAIDAVSAMPLEQGFRGAVLLAPGIYNTSGTITISTSGVVLRGSGAEGETTSTIKMSGEPHLALAIRVSVGGEGSGPTHSREERARTTIRDEYVPSGALQLHVADASGFAVGDAIAILKPVTKSWVEFMQMHDLVRDGRSQTWLAVDRMLTTERRIVAISGNTFLLDVPLSDSFDAGYLNPPGTAVVKIQPPPRITQAGVEHLHIESPQQPISHSQPHFTAVRLSGEDCWIRDLVLDETMNSVGVNGRRITVERVTINRKALHQGASRPAEFAPNGTQILIDRCEVNAENVWFIATGSGYAGPIVILNCVFRGDGRAESHQRWSTGMLYDNVHALNGGIDFRNRGSMGSGHGWSMGWGVAWNCVAKDFIIQDPPGVHNWMIGCIGESLLTPRPFGSGPNLPEGIKDSHGTHVAPASLYLAQLEERLGPQAVRNIGY
ncbi:MAG: hypothetical protein HYZ01_02215 [Ignavibacteriales bacterium]|nr:hypothetical protein [Ignavibacteriales bacterium]